MPGFFDDMGLDMDPCVLRMDDLRIYESKTLMLGLQDDGLGVHLYHIHAGFDSHMVCAVYKMNGLIVDHHVGTEIGIKPFLNISEIYSRSLDSNIDDFLKVNGISFELSDEVPTPKASTSPYVGPRLEDLTLPSPF